MKTNHLTSLADVPADRLTARLYELRVEERHRLVEFLGYLAELDRRKLYLELGFGSTFAFCTDHLGLSKASAYRRTTAARLLRRFPVVADHLADGRLCLTTLVELRDVLSEQRLDEVLGRAAGKTEDEVKALVAALKPRPEPIDLLRRWPMPQGGPASSGPGPGPKDVSQETGRLAAVSATPRVASLASLPQPAALPPPASPSARKSDVGRLARIEPIGEARYLLRAGVGQAFVDQLREARALLSHQLPGGDLEEVLTECVRIAVGALVKKRRGAGKQTGGTRPAVRRTRHVPAAVRDEVWRRDEGRCAFTAEGGRRCGSRWQLELHHRVPFARGGPSTVDNLELRCRAHNAHAAEMDFPGFSPPKRRPKAMPNGV